MVKESVTFRGYGIGRSVYGDDVGEIVGSKKKNGLPSYDIYQTW